MDRQREVYRSLIDPNGIVFDIGANIGNRSAMFQSMCKKVVAVEPQSKLVKLLQERFRKSNVVVVPEAVGIVPGKSTIYFPSDDSLGRHGVGTLSTYFQKAMGPEIFNLGKGWDLKEEVSVTTLDILIEKFGTPSFIKIDVEGFELPVVNGLSRKIPCLSFEFHPQLNLEMKMVLRRLVELGFTQFNYCLAETFEWGCPEWVSADKIDYLISENYHNSEIVYGDIYARS